MSYRLGVDLGTTWTAAAVSGPDGVDPVELGEHGAAMPSVVARDGDDFVVGEAAEHRIALDPASGAREPKRRLGDETPFVLGGAAYGAEALMGHLLAEAVRRATEVRGEAPTEVVLTHPAVWGEYKLDLLREAGRVAGITDVVLLPEPQAAALHYASLGRVGVGDTVAVYDFGGGTFDAAVVRRTEGGFELIGQPQGLERLGGVDLDLSVLAHVNTSLGGPFSALDSSDPETRQGLVRLREECTRAKEALSADTDTSITVTLPGLSTQVRLTREELEAMLRPRLGDTISALNAAVASAGVEMDAISQILLVGGTSRIPLVAEVVARETGRPVAADAHPKLAIVLGAAAGAVTSAALEPIVAAVVDEAESAPATTAEATPEGASKTSRGAASAPKGRGASSGGTSKIRRHAAKIAAGAAVAGGAAAAGVGVAYARGGDDPTGDDDERSAVAAATLTAAPLLGVTDDTGDDGGIDAFDEVSPSSGVASALSGTAPTQAATMAPVRHLGEPIAAHHLTQPVDQPHHSAQPVEQSPAASMPAAPPMDDPQVDALRDQLRDRLSAWKPPPGADPDDVDDLRGDLDGMLDRVQVLPGQSFDDVSADLQQRLEDRIGRFVDHERAEDATEKLDAIEQHAADARAQHDDQVAQAKVHASEWDDYQAAAHAYVDSFTPSWEGSYNPDDLANLRQTLHDSIEKQGFVAGASAPIRVQEQALEDSVDAALASFRQDAYNNHAARLRQAAVDRFDPPDPLSDPAGFAAAMAAHQQQIDIINGIHDSAANEPLVPIAAEDALDDALADAQLSPLQIEMLRGAASKSGLIGTSADGGDELAVGPSPTYVTRAGVVDAFDDDGPVITRGSASPGMATDSPVAAMANQTPAATQAAPDQDDDDFLGTGRVDADVRAAAPAMALSDPMDDLAPPVASPSMDLDELAPPPGVDDMPPALVSVVAGPDDDDMTGGGSMPDHHHDDDDTSDDGWDDDNSGLP